ncbi:MAG: hypothetical protein ACRD2D_09270, partial [Terriglobales bacterium]
MIRFALLLGLFAGLAAAQSAAQITRARHDRDLANVAALQAQVKTAAAQAAATKTAASNIWVAQLDSWLCEAA